MQFHKVHLKYSDSLEEPVPSVWPLVRFEVKADRDNNGGWKGIVCQQGRREAICSLSRRRKNNLSSASRPQRAERKRKGGVVSQLMGGEATARRKQNDRDERHYTYMYIFLLHRLLTSYLNRARSQMLLTPRTRQKWISFSKTKLQVFGFSERSRSIKDV